LQARAELDLPHAFVLTPSQARRVWLALEDAVGEVRTTASCADHMERTFTSAEALMDYEPPVFDRSCAWNFQHGRQITTGKRTLGSVGASVLSPCE
jgi:hypothetical protein